MVVGELLLRAGPALGLYVIVLLLHVVAPVAREMVRRWTLRKLLSEVQPGTLLLDRRGNKHGLLLVRMASGPLEPRQRAASPIQ